MEYKYTTSCSKNELRNIRAFVGDVLRKLPISDIRVNEIVLAVDEVCANMIIHSCSNDPSYSIDLIISIDEDELIFEFVNRGERFDISTYKEPDLKELIEKRRKGGLGLMLIHRIMDKIEYWDEGDTEVYRMYKKID
jgi:serine/threonine-protein kinase RsbW